jgi:hypothetical protein
MKVSEIKKMLAVCPDDELALLRAFAQGYINALVEHDKVYEGFDEFYSYADKWDINIHMNGEPRTIHVVAHPQQWGDDGYLHTDMSRWVRVGKWNMNGTPKGGAYR